MTNTQLITDLHAENAAWETLLAAIGEARMTQPLGPGQWSVKDIVAHLAGWRVRTVGRLRAMANGQADPPNPWPAHLQDDDEVNAWLHAQSRDKPLAEVLAASRQVFDDLVVAAASLPDDAQLDGQPLTGAVLFGHFHEEHEADLRAWLARAGG